MELVPHGNLQEHISEGLLLQEHQAIAVTEQVAQALAYIHQQSFVHRDLKPLVSACLRDHIPVPIARRSAR